MLHNNLKCCYDWIVSLFVRLIPVNGSSDTNSPTCEALTRAMRLHRIVDELPEDFRFQSFFRQYPSESGVPGSDQQTSEGRAEQFDHRLAA
jgi:hypothetical protein